MEILTAEDHLSIMTLDPYKIRKDFPILKQVVNGSPLVYLDNGASSQKPEIVISAIEDYYRTKNSNIHRGVHYLSSMATEQYEEVREKARALINAKLDYEVIFTSGTTASLNTLASSIGKKWISAGDEIIISEMEHHSNIVPWQIVCKEKNAKLKVIPVKESGDLDLEAFDHLLNEKTKIVSVTHVSNTMGTIVPIDYIIGRAHKKGAKVIIDGAQAVPHQKVDVQKIDCDFYCFSAHKMFGPTGVGVLYGKEKLLNELPPYQGGGNMISNVSFEKTEYNELPHKFEAGTPNIAGEIGLGAAIDYINGLGYENIQGYETNLVNHAVNALRTIEGLRLIGTPEERAGVISFIIEGLHPYDIGTILDQQGIAVRTGHHCTQPLMDKFKIKGTVRVSFSFYNTIEEVELLVKGIEKAKKMLS